MSSFDARQLRAIGYVAKKYDRKLSLCTYPLVYFVDKTTGEETKISIAVSIRRLPKRSSDTKRLINRRATLRMVKKEKLRHEQIARVAPLHEDAEQEQSAAGAARKTAIISDGRSVPGDTARPGETGQAGDRIKQIWDGPGHSDPAEDAPAEPGHLETLLLPDEPKPEPTYGYGDFSTQLKHFLKQWSTAGFLVLTGFVAGFTVGFLAGLIA